MVEQYGVARGTLRETLRILETLGVIALRPGPHGGPILLGSSFEAVAVGLSLTLFLSHTKLQEVLDARVAIEPVCARLAAEHADGTDIKELEGSLEVQKKSLEDEPVFLQCNAEFHELIAHAARNKPLFAFVRSLRAIEDGHAIGVRYTAGARAAVLEAHRKIVDEIKRRDGKVAETLMRSHLDEFGEYIARHYSELSKSQVQWQWP